MTTVATHFHVGQTASMTRTISGEMVAEYGRLSGDVQPLHMEEEYGSGTRFGGRVAHGAMAVGFISAVLGVEMAGPDYTVIFLGLNVNFTKPALIGDTITTHCEVTKVREDKPIVSLTCRCVNQHGEETLTGEAVVYVDPYPIGS